MSAAQNHQTHLTNQVGQGMISTQQTKPVTCHLDWLTYTLAWTLASPIQAQIGALVPPYPEFAPTGETRAGSGFYPQAMGLKIGTAYWDENKPYMKLKVELTGKDWRDIEKANIASRLILGWLMSQGANVTRVDFALNLFERVDHRALEVEWDQGRARTAVERVGQFVEKTKRGEVRDETGTVYIGSPRSDRQMRVYDKSRQLKLTDPWLRMELIHRKERAAVLSEAMVLSGVIDAGRAAMRDLFDCDLEWYKIATAGPAVEINMQPRVPGDTRRWLLEQVLPVLERELVEEVGEGRSDLFTPYASLIEKVKRRRGRSS